MKKQETSLRKIKKELINIKANSLSKAEYLKHLLEAEVELKYIDGFWVDENENRWDSEIYTESDAKVASKTLRNCEGCLNCEFCGDSIHCINCKYCAGCYYCINCENCINCKVCGNIKDTEDCDYKTIRDVEEGATLF